MSNLYDLLKKVEEAELSAETKQYLTNVIQLGPDKLTAAAIEKIVDDVLEIKE
jgi:hypothetical protein